MLAILSEVPRATSASNDSIVELQIAVYVDVSKERFREFARGGDGDVVEFEGKLWSRLGQTLQEAGLSHAGGPQD